MIIFSTILLLAGFVIFSSADNPRVKTQVGVIEGFEHVNKDGSKSHIYLGIRYARAPVGELRFEKPMPYPEVDGIMEAKTFAPACFPVHREKMGASNYSEDCLFLNIIRPATKPTNPNGYPVLVFIYGGGFVTGDTEKYGYKSLSENFAAHGIVTVTIQYRVGPLGNIGLWDQMYALHFLQQILPNFGANPQEMTVWGHSAGAASVHALSISPHSEFYFKRAIQASASLFAEWALNENVVDNSLKLAKFLNCFDKNSEKVHDCMKIKTIDEILDAADKMGAYNAHVREFTFNPRLDGQFLPQTLESLMKSSTNIPTLFGLTDKEWAMIANVPQHPLRNPNGINDEDKKHFRSRELQSYIGEFIVPHEETGRSGGGLRNALFEYFVDHNAPIKEEGNEDWYLNRAVDIMGDLMFVVPVMQQIEVRTSLNQESYLFYQKYYNNATVGKNALVHGAVHGNENMYIFDQEFGLELAENDKIIQKNLLEAFRSFILTGVPKSSGLQWPTVGADSGRHVVLNPGPKIEENFEKERMDFWLRELPAKVGINILKKTRLPHAELHQRHSEL
uniref:Carboxylesterase type B domain-containing protein n=1 Tax=Panagrolaimus sp. PS1159 TaxID=55785 RepID=A0AC35G4Z9_9BILA